MVKIDSITVQNLRGIQRLALELNGQSLILVGENGSGKSSLVDAIEYFFTGHISPIEGRADVDKSLCLPNLQGGPPAVSIALRGAGTRERVTVPYPRQRTNIPHKLRPLFGQAQQRPFVLRRSQLLGFVNARDADRYQQISHLIGLEDLDRIDRNWRTELRQAEKKAQGLSTQCASIRARLEQLLGQPAASSVQIQQAINARLADLGLAPIRDRGQLGHRLGQLGRVVRSQQDLDLAQRLRQVQNAIGQLEIQAKALLAGYEELRQAVSRFLAQSAEMHDVDLESLLSQGRRLLARQPERTHCPLCQERIRDRAGLMRRLEERLAQLAAITEGRRQVEEARSVLLSCLQDVTLVAAEISPDQIPPSARASDLVQALEAGRATLQKWQRQVRDQQWNALLETPWPQDQEWEQFRQALPILSEQLEGQSRGLSQTDAQAAALDLLTALTSVKERWGELQAKEQERAQACSTQQQIKQVCDALAQARVRGLEKLRRTLKDDFKRLYNQLHPDEGYGDIYLQEQPNKRASVGLRIECFDQPAAHPLGYLSEGHLDSLGLCIFLAFIKRFHAGFKLVVLDDVLTTVDARHRLIVARLLAQEFADYQLVITTHDRLWAQEIKRTMQQARLYHLSPWRLDRGAECRQLAPSDWAYYARQANDGRPADAISGAGRNLERFLVQMRYNLGLSVPARAGDAYTIGDLYDPFFKWLNAHRVQRPDRPQFAAQIRALQGQMDGVWPLRNWSGAHYNDWAAHVSSAEALALLQTVQDLVKAFSCPVCGCLVTYNRQARVLLCPNCSPRRGQRVKELYRPGKASVALELLSANKPQVRGRAAPMAKSTLNAFLHDICHRLVLPLGRPADEGYTAAQFYDRFFQWVPEHPRPGVADWRGTVTALKRALDGYRQDGQWAAIPDAKAASFVQRACALIALFECPTCAGLLAYDKEGQAYVCPSCDERPPPSPVSAYWFVGA